MDQIIYILINEAMPGYVKIGKTTNLEQRVRDLSRSTSVPLPFEVFYAAIVADMDRAERLLHDAFDHHRVARNREFFNVAPERAVSALKLAEIKEVTPREDIVEDESERRALEKARQYSKRYNFSVVGIPVGSTLTFTRDSSITCRVMSNTSVEYEGKEMSLSKAAQHALGVSYPMQGPMYWEYENEVLFERKQRIINGGE